MMQPLEPRLFLAGDLGFNPLAAGNLAASRSTPRVTVTAVDPTAAEPGNNKARFLFRRSGPTDQPFVIDFKVGGTASSDSDFQSLGTQITIPAGQRSAGLLVEPLDDQSFELTERIVVGILRAEHYALDPAKRRANASINDNDPAPPPFQLPNLPPPNLGGTGGSGSGLFGSGGNVFGSPGGGVF
jgi:hypothetical protein